MANLSLIAALLAGCAVALLVYGGALLLSQGHGAAERHIKTRLSAAQATTKSKVGLRKQGCRPITSKHRDLALTLLEWGPVSFLDHLAGRAGLSTPIEYLVGAVIVSVPAAIPPLIMTGLPMAAALASGPVAAIVAWIVVLRRMARNRTITLGRQLPEALTLMSRSLRAGHPITAALWLVAKEMPAPLGSEFAIVFHEMTYGLDLRDSLANLCGRVEGRELRYMAVAVSIQHSTGGNLAELLDTLAAVLRDVERLHRKIKALSAEGRLSATVLSTLPFVVTLGIGLVAPGYYGEVLHDPTFQMILGSAGGSLALGMAAMSRMVHFRF